MVDYAKWGAEPIDDKSNNQIDYAKWGATPIQEESSNQSTDKSAPSLKDIIFDIMSGKVLDPNRTVNKNIGQIISEAAPKLAESAKNQLGNAASSLYKGGISLITESAENPTRLGKNIAAGAGGLFSNIANIPSSTPSELSELGIIKPETAQSISKYIPSFDKKELLEPLLGKNTNNQLYGQPLSEGDKLAREIIENLPVTAPIIKYVGGKVLSPIKGSINVLHNASKSLGELTNNFERKEIGHQQAVESNRLAQEASKEAGIGSDYAAMKGKLNKNQQDLTSINEELNKPLVKPEETLLETPEESNQRVMNSRILSDKAQNNVKNIENTIGQHLDTGASHDERAAQLWKSKLEENRNEIANSYNNLEKNYEDKNVTIDNTNNIKKLTNDIYKLTQQGDIQSPEIQELGNKILDLQNNKGMPAKDLVSMYRSVNGYMRDAYKKSFTHGMNESERVIWKQRAEEANQKLDELDKTLEQTLGKEDYKQFKDLSERYKNERVPLFKNRIYHQIMGSETLPDNIIKEIRGSGPGMKILRDYAKSDPELLKHIVGQRYDVGSGEEVLNPNERMKKYLDKMPDLQNMINTREQSIAASDKAKQRLKLHQQFSEESERLKNQYSKKLKNRQDLENQKMDLEKSINLLSKHIPELEQKAANKRLNLKEKIKAKHQLARAQIQREKARKKLMIIGGIAGLGYGGKKIINLFE